MNMEIFNKITHLSMLIAINVKTDAQILKIATNCDILQ